MRAHSAAAPSQSCSLAPRDIAAVLASPLIRNYLINYARPLIYSTTMTHLSALAVHKSLELLEEGGSEQARSEFWFRPAGADKGGLAQQPAANVHSLALLLISRLSSALPPASPVSLPRELLHLATTSSTSPHPPTSPIIPLLTTTPRPLSAFLRERGFLVRPITYPTVPKGQERVRVCLHAGNSSDEVEGLVEAVAEWVQREEGRTPSAQSARPTAEVLQAKL